jgi:hypothetical protein
MDNKPTSPFTGLDKALLRSTKPSPPPISEQPASEKENNVYTVPANEPTKRPSDETTERPPDRAAGDYELIRRGFEWYAYQLRKLKKLSSFLSKNRWRGSLEA